MVTKRETIMAGGGTQAVAALDIHQKADAFFVSAIRGLKLDPAISGVLGEVGQAYLGVAVSALEGYAADEIDTIAAEAMNLLQSLSPEAANIAADVAGDVAGAIPIVGTVVEIAKLIFDIASAADAASSSQNGQWCDKYRNAPVHASGDYDPSTGLNTLRPQDIFRIEPSPDTADLSPLPPATALGRILVALTEGSEDSGNDCSIYHSTVAWHYAHDLFLAEAPFAKIIGKSGKVARYGVPIAWRRHMQALRIAVATGSNASDSVAWPMYLAGLSYCWHTFLGGNRWGLLFASWFVTHFNILPGEVGQFGTSGWQRDDTWTKNGGGMAAGAADGFPRTACGGVDGQWGTQVASVASMVRHFDETQKRVGARLAGELSSVVVKRDRRPRPMRLHIAPKKRIRLGRLIPVLRPNLSVALVVPSQQKLSAWDRLVRWIEGIAKPNRKATKAGGVEDTVSKCRACSMSDVGAAGDDLRHVDPADEKIASDYKARLLGEVAALEERIRKAKNEGEVADIRAHVEAIAAVHSAATAAPSADAPSPRSVVRSFAQGRAAKAIKAAIDKWAPKLGAKIPSPMWHPKEAAPPPVELDEAEDEDDQDEDDESGEMAESADPSFSYDLDHVEAETSGVDDDRDEDDYTDGLDDGDDEDDETDGDDEDDEDDETAGPTGNYGTKPLSIAYKIKPGAFRGVKIPKPRPAITIAPRNPPAILAPAPLAPTTMGPGSEDNAFPVFSEDEAASDDELDESLTDDALEEDVADDEAADLDDAADALDDDSVLDEGEALDPLDEEMAGAEEEEDDARLDDEKELSGEGDEDEDDDAAGDGDDGDEDAGEETAGDDEEDETDGDDDTADGDDDDDDGDEDVSGGCGGGCGVGMGDV